MEDALDVDEIGIVVAEPADDDDEERSPPPELDDDSDGSGSAVQATKTRQRRVARIRASLARARPVQEGLFIVMRAPLEGSSPYDELVIQHWAGHGARSDGLAAGTYDIAGDELR